MKYSKIIVCLAIFAAANAAFAQSKSKPTKKKSTPKAVIVKTVPVEDTKAATAVKKNARPETESESKTVAKPAEMKSADPRETPSAQDRLIYSYEFSKPEFIVSKVFIEHDENGKGKIMLQKKDWSEPETDPLQLSAATFERLKTSWNALNFLDSTENYQTARDYSHLGTMKFSMQRDGRTRGATFNWTDNKDAKALADEYRKIGNQFVWIFDINVARQNQPLDTPRLFDALDSLMRRNEISDPAQLIPFLRELSNDERMPLIARNHATKIIVKIEKESGK